MNEFEVNILAADRPFYQGPCVHLQVPISTGQYGILAHHRNVIAAIVPGKLRLRTPDGAEQTAAVLDRTRELMAGRDRICKSLLSELAGQGVEICRFHSLSDKQQSFLEKHFTSNVLPLLSPQIIGRKQPFPFLRNKAIYAVAILRTKSGGERMGIVPCGEGVLRRLVPLPGDGQRFVLVEELIAGFLSKIFAHYKVEGAVLIRLVRSADIHMDERSSEMSELIGMSDRIMVMCDGRVTGFIDGQEANQENIMALATQFE